MKFYITLSTTLFLFCIASAAEIAADITAFNKANVEFLNSNYLVRKLSFHPTVAQAREAVLKQAKNPIEFIQLVNFLTEEFRKESQTDEIQEVVSTLTTNSEYLSAEHINEQVTAVSKLLEKRGYYINDDTEKFIANISKYSGQLNSKTVDEIFATRVLYKGHFVILQMVADNLSTNQFSEADLFKYANKAQGYPREKPCRSAYHCANAKINGTFIQAAFTKNPAETISYCSNVMIKFSSEITKDGWLEVEGHYDEGIELSEYIGNAQALTGTCAYILNSNLDQNGIAKLYQDIEQKTCAEIINESHSVMSKSLPYVFRKIKESMPYLLARVSQQQLDWRACDQAVAKIYCHRYAPYSWTCDHK